MSTYNGWYLNTIIINFNLASIQSTRRVLRTGMKVLAMARTVDFLSSASLNLSLKSSRALRPVIWFTRLVLVSSSLSKRGEKLFFLVESVVLRPPYPFLGYVALNLGNFGQNEIISFLETWSDVEMKKKIFDLFMSWYSGYFCL